MTDYTLFTHSGGGAQVPDVTNANNPPGAHTLGERLTISAGGYQATELHYYLPDGKFANNTTALAQLWDETTSTKLVEINLKSAAVSGYIPVSGWMTVPIIPATTSDPKPALDTTHTYFVGHFVDGSPGEYVFSNTGSYPLTNGVLTASTARYRNGGTSAQLPDTSFGGYFFADLTVSPTGSSNVTITGTGVAAGSGAAFDAMARIAASADVASGSGQAFGAAGQVVTNGEGAAGSGSAFDAAASLTTAAGVAVGGGQAFDATVHIGVSAQVAQGTGQAFTPTISGGDIITPVTTTNFGPCPWDYVLPCAWPAGSEAVTGIAVSGATESLWQASGQRYGLCEYTIRPCRKDCFDQYGWQLGSWWQWTGGWTWPQPLLYQGNWYNLTCGSGCGDSCSCTTLEQAYLPGPVSSIVQVQISGTIMPTGSYRMQDNQKLLRIDGGQWPLCQDMSAIDGAENTWSVTFIAGEDVPALGKMALGELAIQYANAMVCPEACGLPFNMQSLARQGVTIQFPSDATFIDKLPMTHEFIKYANPNKLYRRASVYDIDGPKFRRDT